MNTTVFGHVSLINDKTIVKTFLVLLIDKYKAVDMYDIDDDIEDALDGQEIDFDKCKVVVEDINTCYTEMSFSQTFSTSRMYIAEELEGFAWRVVQYNERIERFIEEEADDYDLTIEC